MACQSEGVERRQREEASEKVREWAGRESAWAWQSQGVKRRQRESALAGPWQSVKALLLQSAQESKLQEGSPAPQAPARPWASPQVEHKPPANWC